MKKIFLIAPMILASISSAKADDQQPATQLYKVGSHMVEMDKDCVIHSVDGAAATLYVSASGHMDFKLANGDIAETLPYPYRHTCKVLAGNDERTIKMKEHTK